MEGHVYILVNSSFPELVKIGRTTKSPELRASELSSTGTPGRFVVAYSVLVSNCVEIESEMHTFFAEKRHTNDREFFEVCSADAINALIDITKNRKIYKQEINESDNNQGDAVLFLAKISGSIYRVGVIKKSSNYLNTPEFTNTLIEMYQVWNSRIIFDIYIEDFYEFKNINSDNLKTMLSITDNYLTNLKNRHKTFEKNYDLRTLSYKLSTVPPPKKVFELTLSLLKPIGNAASSKLIKDTDFYKQQSIDRVNKIGI